MDKLLYIAMSGAKENLNSLAVRSNNLANANTLVLKPILKKPAPCKLTVMVCQVVFFSMAERPGQNFQQGSLQTTGRELDVAVQGRRLVDSPG